MASGQCFGARTGGELSKWAVKAKGIALAVVGVLFTTAAAQNSSSKATGLDGALRSLRQRAVGPRLLTAVALGIAAYGVYSFACSRHARV